MLLGRVGIALAGEDFQRGNHHLAAVCRIDHVVRGGPTAAQLQHLTPERAARDAEAVADLLRLLGPLTEAEILTTGSTTEQQAVKMIWSGVSSL